MSEGDLHVAEATLMHPSVFGVTGARAHEAIDALENEMIHLPAVRCRLKHLFTPGLYTRTIHMPANTLVTSFIHRYDHTFVISQGAVSVWIDGTGWVLLKAPHVGITKAGTRRVLWIHEDTVWTTSHPCDCKTVAEAEEYLLEPRHDHIEGIAQPLPETDDGIDNPLDLVVCPPPIMLQGATS